MKFYRKHATKPIICWLVFVNGHSTAYFDLWSGDQHHTYSLLPMLSPYGEWKFEWKTGNQATPSNISACLDYKYWWSDYFGSLGETCNKSGQHKHSALLVHWQHEGCNPESWQKPGGSYPIWVLYNIVHTKVTWKLEYCKKANCLRNWL